MNKGFYRNCLEDEILSASPIELTRMLYSGALESVESARRCLREGDIEGRGRSINKCFEILMELAASVNRESGGEIAQSLIELYDYMRRLILDANVRQADPPLAEVSGLLSTLLEGWSNCAPEPGEASASAPAEEPSRAVPPAAYERPEAYKPAAYMY